MNALSRGLGKLEQWFIGTGLLIVTFVLFANVVLRYVFNSSLDWADEFSRYSIVWITFVGASVCIYRGAHIGVDAIVTFMSERGQKILSLIITVIAIIFSLFFTYQALSLVLKVMETGQVSATLGVPMLYIYGAMPVGGLLMTLRFTEQLWSIIKGKAGGKTE